MKSGTAIILYTTGHSMCRDGRWTVFALSAGPRPSATKNWAGPASFPFGPASFSSFSCLKIFEDEFRASKFWNLNAKTGWILITNASNVENVIIWVPPPDLIWFMAGVYETISLVLMVVSDTHAFNIRVSTKWPTFCRRHLQMHFPKWKYLYFN